ncbi:hypothetical protein [Rhodopirellula sp. SWK7]|uniref:hypothetical protein n=1 Tax=Rhodopirellula sp. SWK7 TaxID=595460 RepID=UPI0002BFE874|nr:hypothetical protein [Rhodopirellula sp. SWK7]EMI47418.1 membrane protein [Rhodopirellula sp. SWK7]
MANTKRRESNGVRLLACVAVAIAFVFLGVDGYHTGWNATMPGDHGDFFGEVPFINWTHGWPFNFCVRASVYPLASGPGMPNPRSFSGDIGSYSRWPIDNAPVSAFHLHVLILDIGILGCLLAGTWFAIGKRSAVRLRFGIRTLLALSTLVALLAAFRVPLHQLRYPYQIVAYAIVAAATLFSAAILFRTLVTLTRSNIEPVTDTCSRD